MNKFIEIKSEKDNSNLYIGFSIQDVLFFDFENEKFRSLIMITMNKEEIKEMKSLMKCGYPFEMEFESGSVIKTLGKDGLLVKTRSASNTFKFISMQNFAELFN